MFLASSNSPVVTRRRTWFIIICFSQLPRKIMIFVRNIDNNNVFVFCHLWNLLIYLYWSVLLNKEIPLQLIVSLSADSVWKEERLEWSDFFLAQDLFYIHGFPGTRFLRLAFFMESKSLNRIWVWHSQLMNCFILSWSISY